MTRSSCSRQLSALALCLLLMPTGFAQQTAPQNQTAPPPPPPANLPQSNPVAPTPATVPPQETRTLAQQAQQEQQLSISAPTPFRVQIPRSHNPLSPYRPSTAPPLDLHNSPRLEDLIRDGKLYITLQDAISLAIEN
ncbi:MAG: hypothetical protein WA399_08220, partial [Acidobacteriaceae bacterium]